MHARLCRVPRHPHAHGDNSRIEGCQVLRFEGCAPIPHTTVNFLRSRRSGADMEPALRMKEERKAYCRSVRCLIWTGLQDPGKSRSEKRRIDEGHISVLDVTQSPRQEYSFHRLVFMYIAEQVYTINSNLQKQFIIII
jgi:hypothetical protein